MKVFQYTCTTNRGVATNTLYISASHASLVHDLIKHWNQQGSGVYRYELSPVSTTATHDVFNKFNPKLTNTGYKGIAHHVREVNYVEHEGVLA